MILVTGGTGLVGSHLLLELLRKGEEVRALKRPSSDLSYTQQVFTHYAGDEDLFSSIQWVDGDLNDYFSLAEALTGIDQVYHTAAVISFRKDEARKMMEVNSRGTANMVNACLDAGIGRMGYVSSIAALGRPQNSHGVIDENVEWKNSKLNTGYALSKFSAEREVWRGIAEGLRAFIVNPSIILGISDPMKGSTRIFRQVWDGLKFYPVGMNGFVDVRDVVDAMILLMRRGVSGERYILNTANVTYRHLFSEIAEIYGKKKPYIKTGPFAMDIAWRLEGLRSMLTGKKPLITQETAMTSSNEFRYSNDKIRNDHDFTFRILEETLKEYAHYYERQFRQ